MSKSTTHDKIQLLRLAYQGLEDDELREVAKLSRFNTYPAGHILCREGAYEDVIYVVAEGSVLITQNMGDEAGTERVLREGGKGDLIGEMALIQNAPRSATVRTTSPCTMLEMGKKDFETMLSRSPHMAIDIVRITLDRIRENDRTAIEELQKTNKLLRHLDRNKLEFIQVAAHELRTPVTVLKGYANVLGSFPAIKENTALIEVLDGINKGADRMHEIVNTMLDVTRIDTEVITAGVVPVLLKQAVNDVVHGFTKATSDREIKVYVKHKADTPTIYADPALIHKALYHLIVNAIKYTPDGGSVTISTCPITMEDNSPGVEVAVKDTGIGLDPEHHDLVFEKFYQVGSVAIHSSGKTTFKGGGPGLGLAIVRGVARAHGGKVWVESEGYDEAKCPGSTFYLQLPVNSQEDGDENLPAQNS
jgi:signal transduction histidine kinase